MEPQTLLFNEKSHRVIWQKVWLQGKGKNICKWSTTFLCSSSESNNNTHINTHTHTYTFLSSFAYTPTHKCKLGRLNIQFNNWLETSIAIPYLKILFPWIQAVTTHRVILLFKIPGLCDLHQKIITTGKFSYSCILILPSSSSLSFSTSCLESLAVERPQDTISKIIFKSLKNNKNDKIRLMKIPWKSLANDTKLQW